MKRIFLLYLLLMVSLAGRAQGEAIRTKLSATTRMLMSELREKESAGDRGGRRTRGRTELPDEDGEEEARQLPQYAAPGQILHIIHVNRSLPFTKRGALYSAHAEKARG